jgi:hypothetical protein
MQNAWTFGTNGKKQVTAAQPRLYFNMSKESLPSSDHISINDIQSNNGQRQSSRNTDELDNSSDTNRTSGNDQIETTDPNVDSSTIPERTDTLSSDVLRHDLRRSNSIRRLRDILAEVLRISDEVMVNVPDESDEVLTDIPPTRSRRYTERPRSSSQNSDDRSNSPNEQEKHHHHQQRQ